jgi:uncharacterized protein
MAPMIKIDKKYRYSPSDLTRYMESPFASWMDRYVIDNPANAPRKDVADELMQTLAQRGLDHEALLEKSFIASGLNVVHITQKSECGTLEQTLQAMKDGADVIVQAHLSMASFNGYADFLIKVKHTGQQGPSLLGHYHYQVWDTKLSSKTKPTFIIQLCCYADMLLKIQGILPSYFTVFLGNEQKDIFKTNDFFAYYQSLKESFLKSQETFDSHLPPDPANSSSWANWTDYAQQLLIEKDHLFQVATITKSQIKKLNDSGVSTMTQLADLGDNYIHGISPTILKRLQLQASIQKRSADKAIPLFEIIKPKPNEHMGLALLPPHSDYDVFFDIEGYPLDEGGLEYLWGCAYFKKNGQRDFIDFWAHDRDEEKRAFEAFIQWAYTRWKADPSMHIYHYANYEIAACKKLMGRYGICEYEVDQLLRNNVFIDLYKIVKSGLLLGEPRYSIKNVERLYRGDRDTAVGNGGDSVVVYEKWREEYKRCQQGNTWETSSILKDIRDYNIDDCNSTQELVDWLRQQQAKHEILFLGSQAVIEPEVKDDVSARMQLRDDLLKQSDNEMKVSKEQAQLTANIAWSLEFHRREAKPLFWRLFERLGLSYEELIYDLDCLANCQRTDRPAFKPTPRSRNMAYEYSFDSDQEFKAAAKYFYLLGVEKEDGHHAQVSFRKEDSDLEHGLIVLQSSEEPPSVMTLVPNDYIRPDPIPQAIEQVARDYESGAIHAGNSAILSFLMRDKPRINGHNQGAIIRGNNPTERLAQIIHAVKNLNSSYLTIQGPPGSGKSYTGKHVIAELMKTGARVGITSNGHKAINHLLLNTAQYCEEQNIKATFACTKDTDKRLEQCGISIIKNNDIADHLENRFVIGTTAWGFCRDDMAGQLDYLFVDEAGQVSVANLLGMSRSSKNLVLMGDQMQLGQPSQGMHPAKSGLSILDYLLHEKATIPSDMGIFLATTYRMHSAINHFVSQYIYEGQLESHLDNNKRIIEIPKGYEGSLNKEAGIIYSPIDHEGNTQSSDEEVVVIKKMARELIGRWFHTGEDNQPRRQITWEDMLFVAPYNHQVNKLKQALGDKAKVGSVDKFQGQEAPIVFLSMCSSQANESPRGVDFLFDKHRLNVAISRAQSLAIVVSNPGIIEGVINQVDQLRKVSLFNAIMVS